MYTLVANRHELRLFSTGLLLQCIWTSPATYLKPKVMWTLVKFYHSVKCCEEVRLHRYDVCITVWPGEDEQHYLRPYIRTWLKYTWNSSHC